MTLLIASCDSSITGNPNANQPPDTQLSVRDESLLDNLGGDERLVSTVRITWSGDDPDGFVKGYEVRFFDQLLGESDQEWSYTTTTDSLFLLPIRQGERISDVVFEVRAIDEQDLADPTPARTVYPIQNSPPTIRISPFDLPPDTTFNVMSIGWIAEDPDGDTNLARIDVSFNDSLNFVALPPEVSLATFVLPETQPGAVGEIGFGEFVPGEAHGGRGGHFLRSQQHAVAVAVGQRPAGDATGGQLLEQATVPGLGLFGFPAWALDHEHAAIGLG